MDNGCGYVTLAGVMLPVELSKRLAAQFGSASRVEAGFKAAKDRRPSFRVNQLKTDDQTVMAALRETQVMFERAKDVPHAFFVRNRTDRELLEHPLNQEGKIYLQGIASMLPALVLDPQPTEAVLDLCAAPGSKTSQMAAMMGGGRLVACEDDSVRFQKLQNTLRIQGADFVEALHKDATVLHHELPEAFDKILADVPCSAEGRMDLSDPRSYKFWSQKNVTEHAKLQRRLLRSAVRMLKPGGTLVYSTCTLAPEENEGQVEWLLGECPELSSESFVLPVGDVKKWPKGGVTVLPTKDYEGFFVAKFRKK